MRRVYLSGPMSGLPDHNYPAFNAAEQRLTSQGIDVVNPASLNPPGTPWHECMRADIKALCDCTELMLLPGWEHSDGAHLELHIAHRIGLVISQMEVTE